MRRISVRTFIWLCIANLIIWQNALVKVLTYFRFVDEFLTLLFLLVIVFGCRRLNRQKMTVILLLGLLAFLGVLSNVFSDVVRPVKAILVDLFNFSKLYICFLGASLYFPEKKRNDDLLRILAAEIRVIVLIGAALAVISQFKDLGMTYGYRYGFKAFQFVYSAPGILNHYCMLFLLILGIDLRNKEKQNYKYLFIGLLFVVWASTGRVRGYVIIMLWVFLVAISNTALFKENNRTLYSVKKRIQKLLKPQYIVFAAVATAIISYQQVLHYLSGAAYTARNLLLTGGFSVMRDYFPLGAGLATFGTEMAAQYYSPLYYRYGLNTHWALKEGGTELTDCFWPAVGAEFGFFGLVVMIILVLLLSVLLLRTTKNERYTIIAVVTFIAYLVISSTATGIFNAYTTVGFIVILTGIIAEPKEYGVKQI